MKRPLHHKFELSDLLVSQDWTFPVPIAYGPGRFSELGKHCVREGISNPLIVTDRGSKDLPFVEEAQNFLSYEGLTSAIFSDISPNPREEEIIIGKKAYNSGSHDAVIAIGGGSAMDGGKSICLIAHNDIDLWDFEWEKPAPVICPDQAFPKLITSLKVSTRAMMKISGKWSRLVRAPYAMVRGWARLTKKERKTAIATHIKHR